MPTVGLRDPSIRYDDADQEGAQQRARNQDFMFRSYLQNQQRSDNNAAIAAQERMHGADLADRGAGRAFEGDLAAKLQGTFSDRTGAQMGMMDRQFAGQGMLADKGHAADFERTKMTMGPQQTMADIQKSQWEAGAPGRQIGSTVDQMLLDKIKGMQGAGAQPGQATGDGMLNRIMAKRFGVTDPTEQTENILRQELARIYSEADPEDKPAALLALQSGDPSKAPKPSGISSKALGSYAQAQQVVAPDIQEMYAFLRKNNWNISDQDSGTIAQKFQAISQKLDSFRVPQTIKTNIINDLKAKMKQALDENGVIFGAAGSDAISQQYGL